MSCAAAGRATSRIFISHSKNIFANLAFEEFLFRTGRHPHALLLWSNRPCVVIGRHQNPWLESHVEEIERRGVDFARRHSGGGTVYHDLGNLNISFLTPHEEHCRTRNLKFIVGAVADRLGIQLESTSRDDILLNGKKVSGTAARISKGRSYHHLTLLVDTDREAMHTLLHSPLEESITTNATRSTRAMAGVGCLRDSQPLLTVPRLQEALLAAYRKCFTECETEEVDVDNLLIEAPEVAAVHDELIDWSWRFGKTPKFQVAGLSVENGCIADSPDKAQLGHRFQPALLRKGMEASRAAI
ncbi:unnamed protein product, partial [Mesorhabditis spiculigera]